LTKSGGERIVTTSKIQYLIIGNSAGGIGAAEAIREVDKKGTLAIVSDEPYPAYSRPLISEYLAQPGPIDKMLYRKADFYEKNNIQTLLGEKVVSVNPAGHTVKLESGQTLAFGKLLLATGGTPIMPDMEGNKLKGVFTFNRLDEAKAIDEFLNRYKTRVRAVVIGGGLIGVSVTEALVRRGVEVTIVEMLDRVLNTILDEETSAMEAKTLAESGVRIITGHTAVKMNSRLPGEVSGVTLDDGRVLNSELVIVAIGVRPRLDAISNNGIKINRGILVDRQMATSEPDIYACGDCVEAYDFVHGINRLTPIWPNAYVGGRAAGLNMAGVKEEYPGGTSMNAMKYFNVHIVSAGLSMPPDDSYEIFTYNENGTYKKVLVKDNKIAGLIFAGDIEKSGIVYNLMKDGVDVSDFKEIIVTDDFGLASIPEEVWRERLSPPEGEITPLPITIEEPEELAIGD
jgi:NAD(P)H-nitrite reductase large subunit